MNPIEKRLSRVFQILICVVLLGYILTLFYSPIEIEDIWWHLSAGRWMVEHQKVPVQDPFSFTESKPLWFLTQWLGSLSYYFVYTLGGLEGLKILRVFSFVLIISIFAVSAYRYLPFSVFSILIFCLSEGLSTRALLRPFVFNMIFIQIFLSFLLAYQKDGRAGRLWLLPFLGAVWFNFHLGAFVYGFFLIGIFLFVEWVNCVQGKTSSQVPEGAGVSAEKARNLLLISVCYVLSFSMNPRGMEGLLYPFKIFFIPQFINYYKYNDLVHEMLPPMYLFSWQGIWFYVLSTGGAVFLFFNKRDRFPLTVLFVIPIFIFLYAARAADFFALVSVYVILECARNMHFKEKWPTLRIPRFFVYGGCVCLVFLMLGKTVAKWQTRHFVKGRCLTGLFSKYQPVNPDGAIDFLRKNNIQGRLLTSDAYGGFVIWSAYPQLRPMVDGRQLDQRIFGLYLSLLAKPPNVWPKIEAEFDIKAALLDASKLMGPVIKYFNALPTWKLVFMDGANVVYVKKDAFSLTFQPQDFERLKTLPFSLMDLERLKAVSAFDQKRGFFNGSARPFGYIDFVTEAALLFDLGYEGAAVEWLKKGEQSKDPWIKKAIADMAATMIEIKKRTNLKTVKEDH